MSDEIYLLPKNVAFDLRFALYSTNGVDLHTAALAAGDVKESDDDAAFTNITPVLTQSAYWKMAFLAADMNVDAKVIKIIDQTSPKAFMDKTIFIYTRLPEGIKKNAAFRLDVLMVDSTDGRTPKLGLTVSGQRKIDGGTFVAVAGSISEVSNGIYTFVGTAADSNGDVITYRFSATGADDTFITVKTSL
jgi:hypothetical protein